jgi:hypothetical protein
MRIAVTGRSEDAKMADDMALLIYPGELRDGLYQSRTEVFIGSIPKGYRLLVKHKVRGIDYLYLRHDTSEHRASRLFLSMLNRILEWVDRDSPKDAMWPYDVAPLGSERATRTGSDDELRTTSSATRIDVKK